MADDFTRFEEALKAASDAGDVQAATQLATEMRRMLERQGAGMPKPIKLGQEAMPESIASTVGDQFGVGSQRLAGIGSAPMVAGHAIANLAGADNDAAMQNWKSLAHATPNTMGGNIAGNVLQFGALPAGAVGTGMSMAGRTLPRWGQIADVGATQGGLAAATTPGDASDRFLAGAMGLGSTAIPGSVGAVQTTRRATTKSGKQLDLAENIRREIGADADKLSTELQGTYPGSKYGVSPTAAMLTRNPTLEVLETGSRVRTPDQWTNFDRMNAAARWKALEDAAGTPEELAKMRAARDAFTGPQREEALGTMQGTFHPTGHKLEPLAAKLDELSTGVNRPNKDVQTLVGYVKSELDKGATPEQLYTIRKMLTDGIKAGPTSELSQAARAARPQRMEIIGQIDAALNDMSAGKWQQYLESYKIHSPMINSRQALLNVRDKLTYGRPAGEIPASMGEKPAPYALGKLLEQHGTKTFGSKDIDQLIPQHRELATTLLSDLNAQAGVMQPRATLGSPTAGNLANAGRVNQLTNTMVDAAGSVIPVAGSTVAASVKGSLQNMNEQALAELLRNPKKLAEELTRAKAAAELLRRSGKLGAGTGAGVRSGME